MIKKIYLGIFMLFSLFFLLCVVYADGTESNFVKSNGNSSYYLTMDNVSEIQSDIITLKAELHSKNGNVANKKICFYYPASNNSYSNVEVVTDNKGRASVNVTPTKEGGKYFLFSKCEECNAYTYSYLDIFFKPGTFYLTMDNITAKPYQEINIKVQLHSKENLTSVSSRRILFLIADEDESDFLKAENTTDVNGVATLRCKAPTITGDYYLTSCFIGGNTNCIGNLKVLE